MKLPHLNVEKGEFWINKISIWYHNQIKNDKNFKVVISDVRFINEYNFLKKMGCIFGIYIAELLASNAESCWVHSTLRTAMRLPLIQEHPLHAELQT